jgi:release factor glutamine methyltransferase
MNPARIRATGIPAAVLISQAADWMTRAGVADARLDAEVLMAAAAGVSRAALLAGGVEAGAEVCARFERMVARRVAREPLAYIVGMREFYSLEFSVTPGVLIPRPETESVVDAALEFLRAHPCASVLDIGTGSGAIAVAIAFHAPGARLTAVDISKVSLEIAAANARRHRVDDRIAFFESDCYAGLDRATAPFDLIVSNPPYIAEADLSALAPEVRDFEPKAALTDGADGLEFYRRVARGLDRWLASSGEVILELGIGQADAVEDLMRAAGYGGCVRVRDLAGTERVLRSRRAR